MAKISTLTDAFPGSTLNAGNWYVEPDSGSGQPSGTATVSGGTLALSGGTYSDDGYYTSVNSQNAYDLTSSAVFVAVIPGESGTGDGDSGIGIYASNFSDGYNFDVTGGNLQVESTVGDTPTVLHTATYNAASMAWLRVREASGTIYFEYAATASGTYTAFYSTTTETVGSWSATSTYVQLFYGSDSGSSKPTGTAGFQDLNVIPGGGTGFASVGSAFVSTAATFSLTPGGVGDLIVAFAITESTADYASSLSSSNVTWSVLVPHQVIGSTYQTVFIGKVTAASAATVTVSYNAGTPTLRLVGKEFSTTAGFGAVTLDTSGTVNATTTLFPSLSPSHGAGELYIGYAFNAATASAGSTSGYTYYVDANGNGAAWDAACTSGAQQPAWADDDDISGVAVLLYAASVTPFPQPGKAAAGKAGARKGSASGSPGAPRVTRPSPFAQPNRGTRGAVPRRPGTDRSSPGAPYVYVPVVVAPFAQPHRGVSGRPSARRGTTASSPGAPVRPQPAPFPQPGAQPGKAPAPHPAARKGGSAGSPGAPYVHVTSVTSPFTQPNRAVAGRRAARKGSAQGSPATAFTPLVQETSGSSTGTSLTLTFPVPVTPGHAVIIAVCGFSGGSLSNITLGGVGSTFTNVAAGGGNAQVWCDLSAGQASATVVITTTTAGIIAWAYEVSGVVFFDTAVANSGSGTAWTSQATNETIPYPHFVVGIGTTVSSGSITPTASGWTSEAARTGVSGAATIGGVSGFRLPDSSGTYTYSGTTGSSAAWGAVAAAFLAVPQGGNTWGGYIFTEHASYTGVACTFTIPSTLPLVSQALCSIWVGLGNVYQTGIYLSSNSSYTGNVDTSPWSWWFGGGGGAGELWSATAFPTGPGDSLTLTLTVDGTFWYATIANNTLGWSYTEVKSVLGNNVGCWGYNGTTGIPANWGWIYPVNWAEVVIEQEGGAPNQLPGYGSITFTSVTTTPAVTQAPPPQFTVPSATGGITQYPSPFNLAAGSFTMTWNQAD